MPSGREIHVIINPHAAYGRAGRKWPEIKRYLTERGFQVKHYFTKKIYDACHIAERVTKKGARLIASVGGDGTFNEVVNGVMNCVPVVKHLPEVALIPVGTGSDFARTLGITSGYRQAIDVIAGRKTRSMDIGRVAMKLRGRTKRRYFANVLDIGLGGQVVQIVNRMPKILGGFLTFLLSSLMALIQFRRMHLHIWVNRHKVDTSLITIIGAANGQFFGGGMHMAPMARVDDGIFEFIYVRNTNLFKFVYHVLSRVYSGGHLKYRNVRHLRGRELAIQSERVFLLEADGEEERAQEVNVTILPQALKMRTL
ncbi:MAG: diacylglycerol kinase family lipid kinase [candidate division WOR-3 bacterium]|nr:MAG: diacylglycerol kinase family lipid kinase [candidate division WOR-3 bacterium]